MMSFEVQLKDRIEESFKNCFNESIDKEKIIFQPTRKEFEGTHTFVTFPYLKISKKNPEETGNIIGAYLLENTDLLKDFNVVKGFLNLSFKDDFWLNRLSEIFSDNIFDKLPIKGSNVMVEFSSPNTNKPLHLGHLRNNFLGDAVSRILSAAGYNVMKTNLVNDRGIHICKSMLAYDKFSNGETPETSGMKGDHLVGKYYVKFDKEYKKEIKQLIANGEDEENAKKNAPLLIEAQSLLQKWEQKDPEVVGLWEKMNSWVYDGFNATYHTMGITFDKIYCESDTYLLGKDIVEEGLQKSVFFRKENGSVWVDLTDDGLDEKLILRADGTSVYITQDMGTADFKYKDFPMQKSVYVVGNEQDYHFKVLFAIMKKLGRNYSAGLYHLSYGMVDLPSGKMKSREGTVVDADDLMQLMFDTAEKHTIELGKIESLKDDEALELYRILGLGALKYFLLKVDPKKRMLFNPDESVEFHGNTGPFIQYTHARIASILRRAEQLDHKPEIGSELDELHIRELELINRITQFKEIIEQAADAYAPSILAQYIYDLAKEYNGFYQEVPIFNNQNNEMIKFRIALSLVTSRIVKSGMNMLGIVVPQRM